MERKRRFPALWRGGSVNSSIRSIVFFSFTVSALLTITITGLTLYARFSNQLQSNVLAENRQLVEQVTQSLNSYLRNMIRLSDSISYNVIKDTDLATQSVAEELQLLYNNNASQVEHIALFDGDGRMLAAAPPAALKGGARPLWSEWYQRAVNQTENLHFSSPGVQNLFAASGTGYSYVLSLSGAVELTSGTRTRQGVQLITLKYSGISELFAGAALTNGGYVYLLGSDGSVIYHPKQQLMATGLFSEPSLAAAEWTDGDHTLNVGGRSYTVIVRSAGYTGWKVVGVAPRLGLVLGSARDLLFLLMIFLLCVEALVLINALISRRLTDPIQRLEASVQALERGGDAPIAIGGSDEVRRLGRSVQRMVDQMRKLTNDMVAEHEAKQKSELDALQAQITPHFLYNTLDIIVWMIEKGKYEDAVKIVTALARLFRISLSRGKTIIPLRDELEHTRNYLTIQQMRYKDKFRYEIQAPEELLDLSIIKLVVQPIVENAIYHSMDFMDGDGLISIVAETRDGDLFVRIKDNGIGMPPETVAMLLTEHVPISKGSGVGLINVNDRIRLYAGPGYGVEIQSELDVGTTVTLHLPARPFIGEDSYAQG